MDFLSTMKAKAKADKKVIVLPESYEKRNLEAAAECLKEELAEIIQIKNSRAKSGGYSSELLEEILKEDECGKVLATIIS